FTELFERQLLFASTGGYIKLVSGIEFDTTRLCVAATKLEEGDTVASICEVGAADALQQDTKTVVVTKNGYALAFPLAEVPEFKKTGRGVKAISMDKTDKVIYAGIISRDEEELVLPGGKKLAVKKLKVRPRASKGIKGLLS
nr:hypothetical protein [Lachnospiraceae bacterium]